MSSITSLLILNNIVNEAKGLKKILFIPTQLINLTN